MFGYKLPHRIIEEAYTSDRRIHIGLITGIWVIVYPYLAYVLYAHPWDEVNFYVPIAHRMATRGQWLIPHLNGTPFFEKPPLGMWMQAISMTVFGPTLFAARLPSTILGLGTAIVIYFLATELYDWRVGFTAALVFLATPFVSIHNHSATSADLDIYLLFFGTSFVWLVWQKHDRLDLMITAGIAGAAAVLSKSFAAGIFLIALAPVAVMYRSRYLTRNTLAGILSGLAVMLPWPVYAYLTHPDAFVQQMILREIGRAQGSFGSVPFISMVLGMDSWAWPNFSSLGSAGQSFAAMSIPLLVYGSIFAVLLAYRRSECNLTREGMLAWWATSVPLCYTVLSGNHDWYLLPMVPPLAILVASGIDGIRDEISNLSSFPSVSDRQYVLFMTVAVLVVYGVWFLVSGAPESGQTTIAI